MWSWNQLETKQAVTAQQARAGGQVHFVTYAINSRLYTGGVCRSAMEMRAPAAAGGR